VKWWQLFADGTPSGFAAATADARSEGAEVQHRVTVSFENFWLLIL
jgi:hypothetical protein